MQRLTNISLPVKFLISLNNVPATPTLMLAIASAPSFDIPTILSTRINNYSKHQFSLLYRSLPVVVPLIGINERGSSVILSVILCQFTRFLLKQF